MSAADEFGDDGSPKKDGYKIGYRNPPPEHRFQPGHKGFGKRGPRERKRPSDIIERVMSETIKLNIGGKASSMSAFEAMVRQLRNAALKGDPRAFGLVVSLLKASGSEAPDQAISDLLAEDERLLAEIRKRRTGASDDDGGQ